MRIEETIRIGELTLKGLEAQARQVNQQIRETRATLAQLKDAFNEAYGNERKESE